MRKAPRGYTYDPCPGCGHTPAGHEEPHPKEGVCKSCRAILDTHKRQAAELQALGDDAPLRFGVPVQSHSLPYIPHDKFDSNDRGRLVQNAFWQLAVAASAQATGKEKAAEPVSLFDYSNQSASIGSGFIPYKPEEFRLLRPSVAQALRALYVEVQNGMGRAYNEGKGAGSNLLSMLNAGELTNADFERRAGISVAER